MTLVFTVSKITTLLACGWSAPCAIAAVSGELLEWFRSFLVNGVYPLPQKVAK